MKTVLFIPGFHDTITSLEYASLLGAIESKGYKTRFISITWNYHTIDDWVRECEETYHTYNPQDIILAGFSFGAMTAFVAASHRVPAELWLCSLSPYFAEDLANITEIEAEIGKRRTITFRSLSFYKSASSITCPVHIWYGEKERRHPDLVHRAEEAHALLPQSTLTIIPQTGHQVTDPRYVEAIIEQI